MSSLPKKWAKRLEASTDGGSPIFFDFWGVFFRKGKIEEYKKRQHELFDAYNKYRNDNGMKPIIWGESQARKALEAMSSNKSVDDRGNAWVYDEDKGKSSTSKKNNKSQNVDGGKNKFILKFYQTKSTNDLVKDLTTYIKEAQEKNVSNVDENNVYGISVNNIKVDFPTDYNGGDRKQRFISSFEEKLKSDNSLNGAKGIDSLITKAKSNGLKWEKADLDEYRNSSNGTVKKACNIMISTMQRFGWKEDYLLQ